MLSRRLALPIIALTVLAACGDRSAETDGTTSTSGATSGATSTDPVTTIDLPPVSTPSLVTLPTPDVVLPAELPTELVTTDIIEGTGPAATVGDTVFVHYVGVLTADGTEFDNSFSKGAPFEVLLGAGRVIQGWDQGLIGVKSGGRRQLDIPSDLAYADAGSGAIIKPGDAITFVIDVVAIVPATNPADEPTATVEPSANIESFTFEDIIVGDGAKPEAGKRVTMHIVAYRADTGERINSTWADGQAFTFTFGTGQALLGLELTVDNMLVGGRRLATIPFTLAFGEEGSEALGLPASTDLVVLLDLLAVI